VLADDVRAVPTDVTVTTAGTVDMEFTFTGEARSDEARRAHEAVMEPGHHGKIVLVP